MAKKRNVKTVNLYYLNEDQSKPKKGKKKDVTKQKKKTTRKKPSTSSTKVPENTLSFGEQEMLIGMKKIEEPEKKKKQVKGKKKQTDKKKGAGKEPAPKMEKVKEEALFNFDQEIEIGVRQKEPVKNTKKKNTKKQNANIKPKQKASNKKGQAVQANQEDRKQERKPKKKKIVEGIVKGIILFITLTIALIFFLMTPVFNVSEIIIEGNEKVTQQELVSLSGITLGENTYKINKSSVKRAIKENPYIDQVTIERKLPNKIAITVKERKATFAIHFVNGYLYMNNQGYLLETVEENSYNLPIITGSNLTEEDLKPGNRFDETDLVKLEDVLKIIETANNNDLENKITEVNIEDKTNYVLVLEEEQKTVYLGDTSDINTKMLYIKKVIEAEEKPGEIFVNRDVKKAVFREAV